VGTLAPWPRRCAWPGRCLRAAPSEPKPPRP
jgi:hypothetical protein